MSNVVEGILAGASCVAAIGTFAMAVMTKGSIKQNEQHHMDDSRPILMIYSNSGKDLEDQNNRKKIIVCPNAPKISNNIITLNIDGKIRNIGKGIAKNIRIDIEFDCNKRQVIHREHRPIEPSESIAIGEVDFYSGLKKHSDFVDENNNFKKNCYNSICGGIYSWVIYLYYEDIYGNKFITTHDLAVEKNGKTGNEIIPWARFSKIGK
jgi:hypothetical protein